MTLHDLSKSHQLLPNIALYMARYFSSLVKLFLKLFPHQILLQVPTTILVINFHFLPLIILLTALLIIILNFQFLV